MQSTPRLALNLALLVRDGSCCRREACGKHGVERYCRVGLGPRPNHPLQFDLLSPGVSQGVAAGIICTEGQSCRLLVLNQLGTVSYSRHDASLKTLVS